MSENLNEDHGGFEAGAKPAENAEKAREQAAKSARAQARAQKLSRDEKRAKKHDSSLAALIAALLRDPAKAPILDAVLDALESGIPSAFLLGAVSLADPQVSLEIRMKAGKIPNSVEVPPKADPADFDERNIDPLLQLRMNAWFDDIVSALFSDPSVVAAEKFLSLASSDGVESVVADGVESVVADGVAEHVKTKDAEARPRAAGVLSAAFSWFLANVNVSISPRKAGSYAEFILDEVARRARSFLENSDPELRAAGDVDLFGV